MKLRLSKTMQDIQWSFIGLATSALAGFILRIVLGRELGASELGLYTLVFTIYTFGMQFSALGIGQALTKYVAEFKEDVPKTHALVSIGSCTAIFIGCVMGLILYISSNTVANLFSIPELGGLLHIVAIAFPFIALETAILGFLNGLRRMLLFAFINITQNGLIFILTIILVLAGYGVSGAVIALVLSVILLSLFSLFSIRKSIVKPVPKQYFPIIKMLLVFGGYVVLASSVETVLIYTDSILIGYFMGKTDLGYYSVSILLSQAMFLIPQAIQRITTPTISTYHGKGEIDKIEELVNRVMKYIAVFIIPICLIVMFFAHQIIALIFGLDFIPAVLPLQILLIGIMLSVIQTSVGSALSSTAYVNMGFKLSSISAVINIILNLVLIPHLGIVGAAMATSISRASAVMLHLYFVQRLIGIRIHWKWFAKLFTFTALLVSAIYGLGLIVNHYICLLLALIIFIVVLLKNFVTREDLGLIKDLVSRPLPPGDT